MIPLQRTILKEFDRAIAKCAAPGNNSDASLHTIRRICKRIRAYLEVMRRVAFKQSRHASELVRTASMSLSPFRDAHILLLTFDQLANDLQGSIDQATLLAIREQLRSQVQCEGRNESSLDNALRDASEDLRQARNKVAGIDRDIKKREVMCAHRQAYRRVRKATQAARKDSDPEVFHNLRKAAKRHFYQSQFLATNVGLGFLERSQAIQPLTNLLGDSQDLAVLRLALSKLKNHQSNLKEIEVAIAACDTSMESLHTQALQQASQLCFDSPRDFAKAMCGG